MREHLTQYTKKRIILYRHKYAKQFNSHLKRKKHKQKFSWLEVKHLEVKL